MIICDCKMQTSIEQIMILGERNSGTNWLHGLIQANFKGKYTVPQHFKGWKHHTCGKAFYDRYKDVMKTTLFIFVIRDVEPWLKSMFRTPYHIPHPPRNFDQFLTKPMFFGIEGDDPELMTIFQRRYNVIRSYFESFDHHNGQHAIFVNLEQIQQDKGKNLINTIVSEFECTDCINDFQSCDRHTKTRQFCQNRSSNLRVSWEKCEKHLLRSMEDLVESLKIEYIVYKNGESFRLKT